MERVGDFLQMLEEKGYLTSEQREKLWQSQQKCEDTLYKQMIEQKILSDREWQELTEAFYGLPFLELRGQILEHEAWEIVPQALQKRYNVLPFRLEQNRLWLALAQVPPPELFDDLALFVKRPIVLVLAEAEAIEALRLQALVPSEMMQEDSTPVFELTSSEEENWAAYVLNQAIGRALEREASDLHIEPWCDKTVLKLRVDGLLQILWQLPRGMHGALLNRVKIMAGLDIAERRLPQDGHMALRWQEKRVNVRVSTLPFAYGEKAVLRFLGLEQALLQLEQLGWSEDNFAKIWQAMQRPYGLLLATGPTGSGKTTTLYSILQKLKGSGRNIVTIEDPIEYEMAGLNQMQVNEKVGLTFSKGLRGLLRQDPDIVMIGEIRDAQTAMIAVQAANSGHLVVGSLHTNSASGAVLRLLEMGIEPFLIANSLIAVIAQRLVRRNCPHCLQADGQLEGLTLWRSSGCAQCRYVGFKGRLALQEVWLPTKADQQAILERRFARHIAGQQLYRTMREDGLEKARQGLTTLDEVLAATMTAEGL